TTVSNSTTTRAVAYYRASSAGQDTSIEQQRQWAEAEAAERGFRLVASFDDFAFSGGLSSDDRPGLSQLIDFVRAEQAQGRPVPVVILWAADRLSREELTEAFHLVGTLKKAGVRTPHTKVDGTLNLHESLDLVVYAIGQAFVRNKFLSSIAENGSRGRLKRL